MIPNQYRVPLVVAQIAAVLFIAWAIYTPIPHSILKIMMLGSGLLLLLSLAVQYPWGKWVALTAAFPVLGIAVWPTRAPETTYLRGRYVIALESYRGTPYVWGGENARGIDCSGLIRRGLIDALLSTGWAQRDPAMWREAAWIWWSDCSALEMKNGYGNRVRAVTTVKSLNQLNEGQLLPGDLAVLKSGVHVLAFLGDRTWIQADPNLVNGGDKVIETAVPARSAWFRQPVVICRWKCLS